MKLISSSCTANHTRNNDESPGPETGLKGGNMFDKTKKFFKPVRGLQVALNQISGKKKGRFPVAIGLRNNMYEIGNYIGYFGSISDPVSIIIKTNEGETQLEMNSCGKMESSLECDHLNIDRVGTLTPEDTEIVLQWALMNIIGVLDRMDFKTSGITEMQRGSKWERRNADTN
jgi:hypothetical protein